jgi:acetyl esterase
MQWFINQYLGQPADIQNEYASPLLRANPKGLPPTVMITAEYDILTEQCNAYSNKLRNAGVQVTSELFKGMIHGFFVLPDVFDAASDVVRILSDALL